MPLFAPQATPPGAHGGPAGGTGGPEAPRTWTVYILRCGDGTLYTGITPDLAARLEAHRAGKGARYTRGRGPFEVVHTESRASRAEATRREAAIKRLGRSAKLALACPGALAPDPEGRDRTG